MRSQFFNSSSNAAERSQAETKFFAFGMWLRGGFIGASLCAIGLVKLFDGNSSPLPALSLAAIGLLLAVYDWRRAIQSLEAPKGATLAVKAGTRSPVGVLVGQ